MKQLCKYHLVEVSLRGEEAGRKAIELERARIFYARCSTEQPCPRQSELEEVEAEHATPTK